MEMRQPDWCDECGTEHSWWRVSPEREPGDACPFLEDHLLAEPEPPPISKIDAIARRPGRSWPTLVRELSHARAVADVEVLVGLAVRAGRRRLGLSGRAFADQAGVGRGIVGRLETDPSSIPFGKVLTVLREVGYDLAVVTGGPNASGEPVRVAAAEDFASSEFVARDWGGRRFPAHVDVTRAEGPRKASVHDPCPERVPWWRWSRPG